MFAPYESIEIPSPARSAADPRDPHSYSEAELEAYRRHFYAMVTGVDLAVGRVIEVLERSGELADTLIVFGADHGDAAGDHGHTGKGPSYFEPVMRLPLILHWPRGLPAAGTRVSGLFEMVDVLPTLAELCGIPRHRSFQGVSVAPELFAGVEPAGREDVYAFHGRGQIMLRSAETKYLTYIDSEEPRELLFDLEDDPHEFVDRAADPRYRVRLDEMRIRAFHRTVAATTSLREKSHRF
jgi:arylsulfatase A-like enzyme